MMGAGMQNAMRGLDIYAASMIMDSLDHHAAVEKEREQVKRYNGPGTYDNPDTYQYTA